MGLPVLRLRADRGGGVISAVALGMSMAAASVCVGEAWESSIWVWRVLGRAPRLVMAGRPRLRTVRGMVYLITLSFCHLLVKFKENNAEVGGTSG